MNRTAILARPEAIPAELRERRQWVAHKDKVPRVAGASPTGNASSSDPSTWRRFDEALASLAWADGIGYVFAPDDPYAGVDLDGARDPDTGRPTPEAQQIIARLGSYTEASPSGRGFHVIVRAQLAGAGVNAGGIEAYDRGRYFTITGAVHDGLDRIGARQPQLDEVIARVGGSRERPGLPPVGEPVPIGERESRLYTRVLDQARRGYSEAEIVAACLAFVRERFLEQDAARPPWTKADIEAKVRSTLRQERARPEWSTNVELVNHAPAPEHEPDVGRTFAELLAEVPEQVDWLVPGILAPGWTTKLAAREKTGKGTLAYYLLGCLERGESSVFGPSPRATALVLTEEPIDSTREKAAAFGLARGTLVYGYELASMSWAEKVERLVGLAVQHGHRVVFIDNVSRAASIEDEAGLELARAIEQLMDAVRAAGLTCLIDHHHRKMGGSVWDKSRGSTAIAGVTDINVELETVSYAPNDHRRKLTARGRVQATCWQRVVELVANAYIDAESAVSIFSAPWQRWLEVVRWTPDNPGTYADAMALWSVSRTTAERRLHDMINRGAIADAWQHEGRKRRRVFWRTDEGGDPSPSLLSTSDGS